MGIFKKKTEYTSEDTSEETRALIGRMHVIEDWIRQLQSDVNLGWITEEQYFEQIAPFKKELASIEYLCTNSVNTDSKLFDDLMGNPVQWLDEIFGDAFNNKVHEAVDEIDEERKK